MLLLRPLTNEDIKEKVFPKIEKIVSNLKGKIEIKDSIGKRMLAYDIDGFKEGFYLVCNLNIPRENIEKLEKSFKLMNNELIRFLMLDTKKL